MVLVLLVLVLVTPVCIFIAKMPDSTWEAVNERIKNPPERNYGLGKAGYYDMRVAEEERLAKQAADSRVRGIRQAVWIAKATRLYFFEKHYGEDPQDEDGREIIQKIDLFLEDWEDEDPFEDEAGPDDETTVLPKID